MTRAIHPRRLLVTCMVVGIALTWATGTRTAEAAAGVWVTNPATCASEYPTIFGGQRCTNGLNVCGYKVDAGTDKIQCYNTATIGVPQGNSTPSAADNDGSRDGGYVLNCTAPADTTAPYCDNGTGWWCDRATSCYTGQNRYTKCLGTTVAGAPGTTDPSAYTCDACLPNWLDCDTNTAICEIHDGGICGDAGGNKHYDKCANNNTPGPGVPGNCICNDNYFDCDANHNTCEIHGGDACTTADGTPGHQQGCTCVEDSLPFYAGQNRSYNSRNIPLLWGTQTGTGTGDLISFGSATERLFRVLRNGQPAISALANCTILGTTSTGMVICTNGVGPNMDDIYVNVKGDTMSGGLLINTGDRTAMDAIKPGLSLEVKGSMSGSSLTLSALPNCFAVGSNADGSLQCANIPNNGLIYKGLWDVATSPTMLSDTDCANPALNETGWYYIASTDATADFGGGHVVSFMNSDYAICNGTTWDYLQNIGRVTSVFGRIGNVAAQPNDYSGAYITYSNKNVDLGAATVQEAIEKLYTTFPTYDTFKDIFVNVKGDTMSGGLLINPTDHTASGTPKTELEVNGTMSGSAIHASQKLFLDASTLSGAIVYMSGSQMLTTGKGTPGQYLISNGTAAPTWTTVNPAAGAVSVLVGTTLPNVYSGNLTAPGGKVGYDAGNALCNAAINGSHLCDANEITATIRTLDIATVFTNNLQAWISQGPPGFLANSNDCFGWTSTTTNALGAYWEFQKVGGGKGTLTNCFNSLPLACCK